MYDPLGSPRNPPEILAVVKVATNTIFARKKADNHKDHHARFLRVPVHQKLNKQVCPLRMDNWAKNIPLKNSIYVLFKHFLL